MLLSLFAVFSQCSLGTAHTRTGALCCTAAGGGAHSRVGASGHLALPQVRPPALLALPCQSLGALSAPPCRSLPIIEFPQRTPCDGCQGPALVPPPAPAFLRPLLPPFVMCVFACQPAGIAPASVNSPPSPKSTLQPWPVCRLSTRVLTRIAQEQHDAPLSVADRFSLALSYGFAHGAAHSAFFFLSWLPLSLDSGTIYNARCPQLSYFTVGALSTLGLAALLTGAMVLWFDGLERRQLRHALVAPAAHTTAALLTLVNFAHNGCLISVPLLLAGGAAVATAAGRLWWLRTTSVPRLAAGRRASGSTRSAAAVAGEHASSASNTAGVAGIAASSGPALDRTR